ncbi:MAG: InlB B-repeat-containing protein [Clostridia bacterium]|nr:InlB B-repeat-containing protein [Clostridia bacterium]
MKKQGELTRSIKRKFPGGKVLCTALAVTMLPTTTTSATTKPWWFSKYRVTFDNELGIVGNVTLTFAVDGESFIRPITKRYVESISLESYIPTKYGQTFKGWFTDPRTKQNQITIFKFTKPDVLYAKWEKNLEEPISPNDEIMTKDTCYLTDEETKIRNKIIEEKNKAYIDGFGYVAPAKTKTIIVDSDGDINKMVGSME